MSALPFGGGLRPETIIPMLVNSGFRDLQIGSHTPIAVAQRKTANLRNRLRTLFYRRFILTATVE